jgi:hypothetical protein
MHISKKLAVIAVSGIATITIAGSAFAYLTATGTASGAASVGQASPWTIDHVATGGAPNGLLPGSGAEQAVSYTINNVSDGVQHLNQVAVTVQTEADGTTVSGIPGCLAGWFNISTSFYNGNATVQFAPLGSFAGHTSRTGFAKLSMNNNGDVNQDACQGKSIPVILSAS